MPKSVRAKFFVDHVDKHEEGGTVYLNPVYDGSDENKEFFRYTPSGQIVIGTINPDAVAVFEANKFFYVDFTPTE